MGFFFGFFFKQVGKRENKEPINSSKTSPSRNHKPCSKHWESFLLKFSHRHSSFLLWTNSKPWITAALRVPGLPNNKVRFCHGFHLTTYFSFEHRFATIVSQSNGRLIAALTRLKPCVPTCYSRPKWHAEFSEILFSCLIADYASWSTFWQLLKLPFSIITDPQITDTPKTDS